MISKISIANFKAFGEKLQDIPIRPITLIFGPNSSGKSSLLHSLLLVRHALDTGNLNPSHVSIGGDSVDLGGFSGYIYQHKYDNRATLEIEIDLSNTDASSKIFQDKQSDNINSKVKIGVIIGLWGLDDSDEPALETSTTKDTVVQSFYIEMDGDEILRMSYRDKDGNGILQLDSFNYDHPFIWDQLESVIYSFTTTSNITKKDTETLKKAIDHIVPEVIASIDGFFPGKCVVGVEKPEEEQSRAFFAISKGNRENDIKEATSFYFPRILNQVIGTFSNLVKDSINKLHYLGPLRTYPPRHIAFSSNSDTLNEASGGAAWQILLNNEDIREKANEWLCKEKNSTQYKILLVNYFPVERAGWPIEKTLEKMDYELIPRDEQWKEFAEKWKHPSIREELNEHINIPEEIDDYLTKEFEAKNQERTMLFKSVLQLKTAIEFNKELIRLEILSCPDPLKALRDIQDNLKNEYKKFVEGLDNSDTKIDYKYIHESIKSQSLSNEAKDYLSASWNKYIMPGIVIHTQIEYIDRLYLAIKDGNTVLNQELLESDQKILKEILSGLPSEEEINQESEHIFFAQPSEWLGPKFEYEMVLKGKGQADPAQTVIDDIVKSDVNIEGDLFLNDLRNNTVVSLRDVGIGISQVIPVITYAHYHNNGIITIEQPELHLHPALQAELGDLFIESALGNNKNTFLIETHSEHLILRILRRIRETFEASQQKAPPKIENPITPDDVSVIYAKPTKDGTKLYSMKITEDGNFERDWPDGFFEERLEEFR